MVVLVTCKNEEDPIKNEGARVLMIFLNIVILWGFFRRSRAANSALCGQVELKFNFVHDFMAVLLTCKNEKDLIKNEGARLNIDFSDAQGQQTPRSVVKSS